VCTRWRDAYEGLWEISSAHQCFRPGQGGATCTTSGGAEARVREGPEEAPFKQCTGTFAIASEGLTNELVGGASWRASSGVYVGLICEGGGGQLEARRSHGARSASTSWGGRVP
jgi:hypothetical protein